MLGVRLQVSYIPRSNNRLAELARRERSSVEKEEKKLRHLSLSERTGPERV